MSKRNIVAVVGRPNVGKSTLFNALAGSRIAIVQDTPGVTRDRIYQDVEWLNHSFTLIDTGGIEPDSKDIILAQMRDQAQIAIDTADVIIFMVDVKQGLTDSDSKVADMLRKSGKPIVLCVNKVDNYNRDSMDVYEFYNLGIGEPFPISAVNKQGIGDLLEEVVSHFSKSSTDEEEDEDFSSDFVSSFLSEAELSDFFSSLEAEASLIAFVVSCAAVTASVLGAVVTSSQLLVMTAEN